MDIVTYVTHNRVITTLGLLFVVFIATLGILGGGEDVCHSSGSGLFATDSAHLLGNDCASSGMFWIVLLLAVVIQVMRNILWIKSSQATRMALKKKKGERPTWSIVSYTIMSTLLHLISILVILGGNLWVMLAILIGNVIGVLISVGEQDADKERLTTAILHLKHKWECIEKIDSLNEEETCQRKELEEIRDWMREFLSPQTSRPGNSEPPNSTTLKFRI